MINIGIYIYDDAEVLDFSGPFEVFAKAAHLLAESFRVFLIAEKEAPVNARAGFTVLPHYDFDNHPTIDVLIVPGGLHDAEMKKPDVHEWLQRVSATTKLTASVCTGAFILAQAKVLTAQQVTTHWQDINELRTLFPSLTVLESVRWIEDGKFITSAGISAGIDMALHLVSRLQSPDLAKKTARQMEYDCTKF